MGNEQIAKWFSGKALTILRDFVLPTLDQAAAAGYWPTGASRKVKAALNKQTVAIKLARANWKRLDEERKSHYSDPNYAWDFAMMFGQFERAPELARRVDCLDAKAAEWARDFAPIAELVAELDATRPKPVLLCKTLSRTVLDNLGGTLGVDLKSIEAPEIVWEWKWIEINGKRARIAVGRVIWPEGTRHNTSPFITSQAGNSQCHACGHAIRNGWNWVPLVAQTVDGPISLWVGRDCAKNLFGCVVDGEADYTAARAAA